MKTLRFFGMAIFTALAVAAAGCGGGSGGTPTAPSAPTGVQATPGDGQVTVSWTSVSGATSYNVYYSTTAGAGLAGTKVAEATSPHAVTGLTNGTAYYFVVTAVNSAGESAASSEASAVPAVNPPPAAPTGVTATGGNGEVTIAWSAVSGATSYNIYWSTTSGAGTGGTQIATASNPYVHTGRTNGTTYYYVVTAVNANGESTPSAEVSATPTAAPYIAAIALTLQGGGTPPFGFLEQARVCTDSTCSTPITNATVTVNGATLTYDSIRQQYSGTQAIAAGAAVSLQVTVGGHVYSTTGTQFTSAPSVSAPAANATWLAGNANTISWSGGAPTAGAEYAAGIMDSNGDFVFPASGGGGGGGPASVPIGTTTLSVPAGSLSAGSYKVMVGIGTAGIGGQSTGGIAIPNTANGSGLWLGYLAPLVPITVQSGTGPYISALVLSQVGGGVPPFGFTEQVEVFDATHTTPITNATVTVNGTALSYDPTQQRYLGTTTVAAGATVTLQVTIGTITYTVAGTQFTTAPAITAPTAGAIWQHTQANNITWTAGAPTTGAEYAVGVVDANTGNFAYPPGGNGPQGVAIGTSTLAVPAYSLTAGSYVVLVGIGTTGIAGQNSGGIHIPGTAAGSGMWLGYIRPLVPITVQ